MGMAMIFLNDPEHFNAQVPVPTNAAYFLDPRDVSKVLFAVAKSFDIFTFWLMILLGIGYSEATGRKVKVLTMFLCFFGIWMLISGLAAGADVIPKIPPGTSLRIRLGTTLTSKTNKPGDTFRGEVLQDVVANGKTIVPEGSLVSGHVAFIKPSGRFRGKALMR